MVPVEECGSTPMARGHPIADAVKAEVLESFEPTGDARGCQLALHAGEIVWVLEQHESGWWGGHKDGDDLMGWFPADMLQIVGSARDDAATLDAYRARERAPPASPTLGTGDALRTSDMRAVASPQAGHRRRTTNHEVKEKEEAFQRELAELSSRWESELAAERRRSTEALAAERRRGADALAAERRRLTEAAEALEAELAQARSHIRALEEANAGLKEERAHAGRAPSADISRRLFAHGHGLPPDGTRTPPAPTVAMTSAATAPVMPTGPPMVVPTLIQPASARYATASMPRPGPSPRSAASAPGLQWLAAASAAAGGPPPSPHHPIHRPFPPAGREPITDAAAQVRTLVSEFERRSNSQGAPPRTDPSPNRQFVSAPAPVQVYTTAASLRLRPTSSSSSRAGSREVPIARVNSRHDGDPETPQGPVHGGEEVNQSGFNFGMSPMPRQAASRGNYQVQTVQVLPGRAQGVVSSSPSAKVPQVSVQERIRQFNPPPPAGRYGR